VQAADNKSRKNDSRIEVLAKKRPTKPGSWTTVPVQAVDSDSDSPLRNKGLRRMATMRKDTEINHAADRKRVKKYGVLSL
jgi:hypothetical protein